MNLEIGDHVIVLDEDLEGKVVRLTKEMITLTCEDGFEYDFKFHQVFKLSDKGETEYVINESYTPSELNDEKNEIKIKFNFDGNRAIFDLHLEELTFSHQFQNDHEALVFQLNHVKEIFRQAKIKRIRNLVLIHGMGKGVLRNELRRMIKESYPSIEYFDGSYQKYGGGATEIIIHNFKEED